MNLNLFKDKQYVIASYMRYYKINDILDLATDGWKILQIDQKNQRNNWGGLYEKVKVKKDNNCWINWKS